MRVCLVCCYCKRKTFQDKLRNLECTGGGVVIATYAMGVVRQCEQGGRSRGAWPEKNYGHMGRGHTNLTFTSNVATQKGRGLGES